MNNKAHKWAEMIKTKADNMELVVFTKVDKEWKFTLFYDLVNDDEGNFEFFLCLPQHKEVCLHWLNGGAIECNSKFTKGWEQCAEFSDCFWKPLCGMMRQDANYRIKPRKEKLWIAVNIKDGDVCMCMERATPATGYQIIEIEVEV